MSNYAFVIAIILSVATLAHRAAQAKIAIVDDSTRCSGSMEKTSATCR